MRERENLPAYAHHNNKLHEEGFFYRGTVLVIESDRALRELMDLSLKRLGFLVRTSEEPSEILSILEMEKPQVVLLDLFLLGYSSLELLRQIKDSGLLEHTRVIVISAFGFMEVLQQAIILGAADFVVKPFDMDVLAAKVLRGLTAL